MQETQVEYLVQEDPTCFGAAKPVYRLDNYRAHTLRACALQQERPPQREAHTLQPRAAPARRSSREPSQH